MCWSVLDPDSIDALDQKVVMCVGLFSVNVLGCVGRRSVWWGPLCRLEGGPLGG